MTVKGDQIMGGGGGGGGEYQKAVLSPFSTMFKKAFSLEIGITQDRLVNSLEKKRMHYEHRQLLGGINWLKATNTF